MVSLTIDGVKVEVPNGTSVLEAARSVGVRIPTLCYLKGVNAIGACRMCLVEMVEGGRGLQAACVLPAANGMVISTNSKAVQDARRVNLELILSNHDKRCLSCVRNRTCELQKICEELNIEDVPYEGAGYGFRVRRARPQQVHTVPPLRRGLRQRAENRRCGRHPARFQDHR